MARNAIKEAEERNMKSKYEICNHCLLFKKDEKSYGKTDYGCKVNPGHNPRPNRKACEQFKDKFKADDGDWCEKKATRIVKSRGDNTMIPCNNCDIRCLYAADKSERNYLRKESNNATQTTK